MYFNFVKHRKLYYIFSGILALGSITALWFFGLNFGIDFTGGTIIELEFEERPANLLIQENLEDLELGEIVVQPTGERGLILRTKEIDEDTHQEILSRLGETSKVEEKRFESIGPVIGLELRQKIALLIFISLFSLLLYIAIAFRKVSWPISGWQYGVISIITLFFDVLITIGLFSLLGKLYNVQFSIPIVTALLTILGYTINDKVIVFDRIRENIINNRTADFNTVVDQSLNQTLSRSISTGSCTLLVLLSLFFLGGETLKYFALTLIIGIIIGTYSSLFLASSFLVSWPRRKT